MPSKASALSKLAGPMRPRPPADRALHDAAARQRSGPHRFPPGRACSSMTGSGVAVARGRTLPRADYGVYGVLVSFVTWLGMLVAAGVPGATSKLLADLRADGPGVERAARLL